MNECVRTGFTFRSPRGPTRVGDLFFNGATFQIRGVPDGARRGDHGVDAIIAVTVFRRRGERGRYSDSDHGVKLLGASQEFRVHIAKWHPEALDSLPTLDIEAAE